MTTEYCYIQVESTSRALQVESALLAAGIPCKLVPVPRHLSSDCGVCVRIAPVDREACVTAMDTANVQNDGIFPK